MNFSIERIEYNQHILKEDMVHQNKSFIYIKFHNEPADYNYFRLTVSTFFEHDKNTLNGPFFHLSREVQRFSYIPELKYFNTFKTWTDADEYIETNKINLKNILQHKKVKLHLLMLHGYNPMNFKNNNEIFYE